MFYYFVFKGYNITINKTMIYNQKIIKSENNKIKSENNNAHVFTTTTITTTTTTTFFKAGGREGEIQHRLIQSFCILEPVFNTIALLGIQNYDEKENSIKHA